MSNTAQISSNPILSDPRRLSALAEIGLKPGRPPEANAVLDRLTSLVAKVLRVPLSLVSLVEEERQAFLGMHGSLPEPFQPRETPITHSFCQHVVATGEPLVIGDSLQDERVRANPAVHDIQMVAYIGVPLITAEGDVLGSLCAIDHSARAWTAEDLEMMRGLAGFATTELDLRRGAIQIANIRRETDDLTRQDFEDRLQLLVHDLRTPLNSLLLGLQTLPLLGEHNDEQREALELATRGGQALVLLVDDILDLGAAEAAMRGGRSELSLEEVDACGVLAAACSQVRALASAGGIEFTLVLPPHPQTTILLEADRDKLERALVNLLGNAIKFTPNKGVVSATVQPTATGDQIAFTVRDSGRGIAKEDFERIFERFVRVGGVSSERGGRSSGLGLAFCKMVADTHHGRIDVESEPGKGSSFSLRLPRRQITSV